MKQIRWIAPRIYCRNKSMPCYFNNLHLNGKQFNIDSWFLYRNSVSWRYLWFVYAFVILFLYLGTQLAHIYSVEKLKWHLLELEVRSVSIFICKVKSFNLGNWLVKFLFTFQHGKDKNDNVKFYQTSSLVS